MNVLFRAWRPLGFGFIARFRQSHFLAHGDVEIGLGIPNLPASAEIYPNKEREDQ
jgi:hypothetical protein